VVSAPGTTIRDISLRWSSLTSSIIASTAVWMAAGKRSAVPPAT
jgi:hypothetical protein